MLLELKHIDKSYQQGKMEVPVLKDINISVEEGDYLAIMGPSGSGKSTLMNIIGCLDVASAGTYYLNGQELPKKSDKSLSDIRLKSIGFVFQNFNLLPRQTALDNVALPLQYAGIRKRDRKLRAKEALIRVGLEDRITFKPTQLSGGQKQRVAIARALINNPTILLADEPTGALDSKSGQQVLDLFDELNKEGVTIILITHEREVALRAGRIVQILDGRLLEEAPSSNEKEETT